MQIAVFLGRNTSGRLVTEATTHNLLAVRALLSDCLDALAATEADDIKNKRR